MRTISHSDADIEEGLRTSRVGMPLKTPSGRCTSFGPTIELLLPTVILSPMVKAPYALDSDVVLETALKAQCYNRLNSSHNRVSGPVYETIRWKDA